MVDVVEVPPGGGLGHRQSVPEDSEGKLGLLRADRVAEGSKSVHTVGKPMSASTNCGLKTACGEVSFPALTV